MYFHGYRMSEVPILKMPNVKKSLRVGRLNTSHTQNFREYRTIISKTLPLYLHGATPPRPDPGCPFSGLGAVAKRFGFEPPKHDRNLRRKFYRFIDLWLKRNLKPLDEIMTFDTWLEATDYSQGRKQELRTAWAKSDGRPNKRWNKIKSFWKDETYPSYKFPRAINSRVDEAKCFFGPIVQAISDVLFQMPWFIKKVPVSERPLFLKQLFSDFEGGSTSYRATDATSYEAHFDEELMMGGEYRLFKHMVGHTERWQHLDEFLKKYKAGKNVCQFKMFTIIVQATRMSGEMDTSMSNGFMNLMFYLFLAHENGLREEDVRGVVEGDDGLFASRHPHLDPTTSQYAKLGIDIKIESTQILSEASFCGQVYDMEDLIVVADPREVIARIGLVSKKYVNANLKTQLQLLRARGYSLCYQYNGCPLLSTLGRRILELTDKVVIEDRILFGMDQWERSKLQAAMLNLPVEVEPGLGTRLLVEKLYKIDTAKQIECESILKKVGFGPIVLPLEFPKEWIHYWNTYSCPYKETNPFWLVKQSPKYLAQLKAIPNLRKALANLITSPGGGY